MAWFFAALKAEAKRYAGEIDWFTKTLNFPPGESGKGLVAISGKMIDPLVA